MEQLKRENIWNIQLNVEKYKNVQFKLGDLNESEESDEDSDDYLELGKPSFSPIQ